MRLKHVKGAEEAMQNSKFICQNPLEYKGVWKRSFMSNDTAKLFVEIGMGKGKFITTLAATHPQNLYIGIEKFSSVLIRGLEKQEELQLPNLVLIRMDAEKIEEIFDEDEIDTIYLNFSDPWPKDRHAKRRLTSPQFLSHYEKILKGDLEFKTDNMELFDFSLESLRDSNWNIKNVTRDLHHDATMNEGNVMTEYEEKFSDKGNPIAKVIAHK